MVSEPNRAHIADGWFSDRERDAAIKILGPTRKKVSEWGTPQDGVVWVKVGDTRLYSCYVSPNTSLDVFGEWMDGLERDLRLWGGRTLVCGDLNAKSALWGASATDRRGRIVEEFAATLGLATLNEGDTPTFTTGVLNSHPDVTMASCSVAAGIEGWRVLDEETLSDHRYVFFELDRPSGARRECWRWRPSGMDAEKLVAAMRRNNTTGGSANELSDDIIARLRAACREAIPREKIRAGGNAYWWCEEVRAAREACVRRRRTLSRLIRRNAAEEDVAEASDHLREARSLLRKAVARSKDRCWKELQGQVDDDPWGQPYRIVMKRFRAGPTITTAAAGDMPRCRASSRSWAAVSPTSCSTPPRPGPSTSPTRPHWPASPNRPRRRWRPPRRPRAWMAG